MDHVVLMTPAEAAARAGVYEDIILAAIHAGSLPAAWVGGRWRIDPAEIDARWERVDDYEDANRSETAGISVSRQAAPSQEQAGNTGKQRANRGGDRRVTFPAMTAATLDEPEFFTVSEAARFARRTPRTIHQWVHDKRLGDYGTPGGRLIKITELRALIEGGSTRQPPR